MPADLQNPIWEFNLNPWMTFLLDKGVSMELGKKGDMFGVRIGGFAKTDTVFVGCNKNGGSWAVYARYGQSDEIYAQTNEEVVELLFDTALYWARGAAERNRDDKRPELDWLSAEWKEVGIAIGRIEKEVKHVEITEFKLK